jgi:hypothetical protein
VIVTERSEFLMKEFFAKGLSGRKIELDEVIEPEQDDQSSATPENVLEAATAFMAHASTMCCSTGHQSSYFNQVGHHQIARFEDEILLDNSNQQYTKKR